MCLKEDNNFGYKIQKERIKLLFGTNMTGSHKLEPLVIGRYLKPRYFKNVKKFPCAYTSNSSCWMTRKIF